MAYDRFVSIFRPLQYHTVMTPWKVKQLISFLPKEVNIFMSMNYILIPPLLHPIVYGIKTKEIRQRFTKAIRSM
ncbi:olfactory receptor 51G1-like [Engraulis encrasicolus]|uniref:olfactory receptor 51G1-like n=1 Tax=Engraulis encrasicolus TaxID=184585 RepID=UPI002FD22368